ncbi:lipopolysaccharide transport periplasmic protein LptA [Desertibaculum subflavum]|uniref:lipopolysaccharide transport periplasmic protein LptA n=1 Tax=Desertibaculum subflavum TaxID=2268458 RepID=UPI0013C42BAD
MRRRILAWSILLALAAVLGFAALPQPALAQSGHDSAQPVQINADSLEVQQDKKVAIFKGNVDATQGDLRLKSDLLRVYYSEGGQKKAGAGPGGNTSITRLEAEGHVFVSRPEQTGRGERGVYDLEKRTIVLEGNVVLTDRENVVKGTRATMDLNTRQSTVQSGPAGRVQGVFQPKSQ